MLCLFYFIFYEMTYLLHIYYTIFFIVEFPYDEIVVLYK